MAKPFTSVYEPAPAVAPVVAPAAVETPRGRQERPEVLKSALKTEMSPYAVDLSKYRNSQPVDVLQDISINQQKLVEANAAVRKAELQSQSQLLGEQAVETRRQAQQMRDDLSKHEQKLSAFSSPEFHPTKENAQTLGELFSLISTSGIMLGGAGKLASINALNAMGGMLKGWQAGRADLFKREKETFDKEFQRMKTIREDLQKTFAEYQKIRLVDNQAAMYKLQELAAKAGADSIIKAQINAGKIDAVGKTLEAQFNIRQKEKELRDRLQSEADRRTFELKKIEIEKQYSDERERKRAEYAIELEREKQKGKKLDLPKDTKTKDEYRARYEVIKNIEDIQSLLDNPKYSQYITPLTKFTPDILANLGKDFPELQQKLARIQAIEFQIGGKALTASEQKILEPIYGWRGLTVDALKERLKGTKDNFALTNSLTEEYYPGLKDVRDRFDQAYEKTGKVPSLPSTDSSDAKIATKADISATAKANGITEEEVKKRLREKGFKIEGE